MISPASKRWAAPPGVYPPRFRFEAASEGIRKPNRAAAWAAKRAGAKAEVKAKAKAKAKPKAKAKAKAKGVPKARAKVQGRRVFARPAAPQ